jgi:hypothetical protein
MPEADRFHLFDECKPEPYRPIPTSAAGGPTADDVQALRRGIDRQNELLERILAAVERSHPLAPTPRELRLLAMMEEA